jgi:hypothetical protein
MVPVHIPNCTAEEFETGLPPIIAKLGTVASAKIRIAMNGFKTSPVSNF